MNCSARDFLSRRPDSRDFSEISSVRSTTRSCLSSKEVRNRGVVSNAVRTCVSSNSVDVRAVMSCNETWLWFALAISERSRISVMVRSVSGPCSTSFRALFEIAPLACSADRPLNRTRMARFVSHQGIQRPKNTMVVVALFGRFQDFKKRLAHARRSRYDRDRNLYSTVPVLNSLWSSAI